MARRNVWRNRRRTVVTVAAMSLALLVMVLYAGLMEGYLRDMERSIVELEVGDLQLYAGDYRDDPSIYTRIEEPDALLETLDGAGLRATGRLLAFGLAAAGDSSAGVSFRGIDVVRDARVSGVNEQVSRGRWLEPGDDRGVVIGRRLARMLGVEPGAELLVLSQGADGSMAYDLYTVRGVLLGIGDATDRTGVFMTAAAFRELFVVPTGVHQIIMRRDDSLPLEVAATRARAAAPQHDVQTWRELLPTLASMIDSARAIIAVMFIIVYLAVAILILNATLMAVFERIREIGVLKAVGVGPFGVMRMLIYESALQTGLAVAVGMSAAVPGLLYLERVGIDVGSLAGVSIMGIAMNPVWRAAITPSVLVLPLTVLVLIVGLAVLYPSIKAARIEPVEAIRHR